MSLHRHNPKRDQNEPEVIEALERCGFTVDRVSEKGKPDLTASRRGFWYWVEVKQTKGTLTPAQVAFRDRHKAPVAVLRSGIEAITWSKTVP